MTDQDLLSEMQLALLEPPDGGASFPSEAWTREEVLDAVNASLRDLARQTTITVTLTTVAVFLGNTGVTLPADWIGTVYLVWRTLTNQRIPLSPAGAFEADTAAPGWEGVTVPARPYAFADLDTSTLRLRLIPTPGEDGTLEILYAQRPAEVAGAGTLLPFPDEFASAEKYGALETLLNKVGRMQDPERASYCGQRRDVAMLAADLLLQGGA